MLHSLQDASLTANEVIKAFLPDGCQSTLHHNSECIFRAILFCGESADAVKTIASANAADDDDDNINQTIYIGAGVVVFLLFGMFAMVIDIQSSRTRRRDRVLMDRDRTNTVRIDNPTFGKGRDDTATTTAPAVSTATPDGNQQQGVNGDGNHNDARPPSAGQISAAQSTTFQGGDEDVSSDSDAQSASCQDWDTDEDSSDSDAQPFQGEDTYAGAGVAPNSVAQSTTFQGEDNYEDVTPDSGAQSTTTFQGEDTYQDVHTTFQGEDTYEDVTPNNTHNTPFEGMGTYEYVTADGAIDTRMAANATYESIATTSSSSQEANYDTMATTYDQLPTLDAEEDDE